MGGGIDVTIKYIPLQRVLINPWGGEIKRDHPALYGK